LRREKKGSIQIDAIDNAQKEKKKKTLERERRDTTFYPPFHQWEKEKSVPVVSKARGKGNHGRGEKKGAIPVPNITE